MIGRLMKLDSLKRCDLEGCTTGPVKSGYRINSPGFAGFFCGAVHARVAHGNMEALKKEHNLKIE